MISAIARCPLPVRGLAHWLFAHLLSPLCVYVCVRARVRVCAPEPGVLGVLPAISLRDAGQSGMSNKHKSTLTETVNPTPQTLRHCYLF